ncbi:MAG: hypothetical protein CMJ46_14395 [Planctomyces sp.]|nr:hypothetical protein [Planctomyces sp.]
MNSPFVDWILRGLVAALSALVAIGVFLSVLEGIDILFNRDGILWVLWMTSIPAVATLLICHFFEELRPFTNHAILLATLVLMCFWGVNYWYGRDSSDPVTEIVTIGGGATFVGSLAVWLTSVIWTKMRKRHPLKTDDDGATCQR